MAFSDRLEQLRKNRDLSQEELARLLNINRTSIAHYESSKSGRIPRPRTLRQMASFFDVSIDYLLDGADDDMLTPSEERFLADTEELSVSELKENYQFTIDGKPASQEELEAVLMLIRSLREKV